MNNTERSIQTLTDTYPQTAAELTHGLKALGNGSMQNGLNALATESYNWGHFDGTIKGLVIGVFAGIAVTATGMNWWHKHRFRQVRQAVCHQYGEVNSEELSQEETELIEDQEHDEQNA